MIKNIHSFLLKLSILILSGFLFLMFPVKGSGYCEPSYNGAGTATPFFTHFLEVHTGSISNVLAGPGSVYEDFTNQSTKLVPGQYYHIHLEMGNGANTQTAALWIDFNQDGKFQSGERLFFKTDFGGSSDHAIDTVFKVPENAKPGTTRLRLGTKFGTDPPDPCFNNVGLDYSQNFHDYTVEITEPHVQIYEQSNAFRPVVHEVVRGNNNELILGIEVQTNETGTLNPLILQGMNFNMQGTDQIQDVSNARLFFTGQKPTFDTHNQVDSENNPGGSFSMSPNVILQPGTNYLWLAYDISSNAGAGNAVNAQLTGVTVDGLTYDPVTGVPDGERRVGYCYSYGVQNIFVHFNRLVFGDIDNSTGQEPTGYGDYTAQSTVVYRDSTYPISLFLGNGANNAQVRAWIDFHQTLAFEPATDLALDVYWPAGSAASPDTMPVQDSIYIPAGASIGQTRMRISSQFNVGAPACAQPLLAGEVEDYTLIIGETGYPLADFSFNKGCVGDTTYFTENASVFGNFQIIDYHWDFGDGDTSSLPNPAHVYQQSGSYEVSLTVTTDAPGNPSHTISRNIHADNPESGFYNSQPRTVKPINFYGTLNNASAYSWKWIIYDTVAGFDTLHNRSVQYNFNSSGTYDVKLIVTASGGCTDTTIKQIEVPDYQPPIANFNISEFSPFKEQSVQLVDLSVNDPVNRHWTFMPASVVFVDGTSDTSRDPVVEFNFAQNYTIQLVVDNPAGSDTTQKTISVQGFNAPVANFAAEPTEVKVGQEVGFQDLSTGKPVQWAWDFGDGDSAFIQHPYHSYDQPGFYNVSLTVSNPAGSNTMTVQDKIEVVNTFIMCDSETLETSAESGHLYDSGGPSSNYDSYTNCGFLIKPPCAGPISLHFHQFNMNSGDYIRVYDGINSDGEPLFTGSGFTGNSIPDSLVAYSGAMYIEEVNLNFSTHFGFHASWTTGENQAPVASFTVDTSGYVNSPVLFTNTSEKGVGDIYLWDFNNDGNLYDTGDVIYHIYQDTGTYQITLFAENCKGSDTATANIKITNPQKPPKVNFFAEPDTVEMQEFVFLHDLSLHGPDSWEWNFFSPFVIYLYETTNTSHNPVVFMFEPGYYDVSLTASNAIGTGGPLLKENYILVKDSRKLCGNALYSDVVMGTLTDDGGKDDAYSAEKICAFNIEPPCADEVYLIFESFSLASGDFLEVYDGVDASTGTPLHPGQGFSDGQPPPDTLVAASGRMFVRMTTDDGPVEEGFVAKWHTRLPDSARASFTARDSIVMGETVQFENHSSGIIDAFYWDFIGDGQVQSQDTNPEFQFTQSGTYEVSLVTDACVRPDTFRHTIFVEHINSPPVVDFEAEYTRIPVGETNRFTDLSKELPWSWQWTFDPPTVSWLEGTGSTSQHPVVEFDQPGVYEVTLEADNFLGTGTETKTAYVTAYSYCYPHFVNPERHSAPLLVTGNDTIPVAENDSNYIPPTAEDTLYFEAGGQYQLIWKDEPILNEASQRAIWLDHNQDGSFDLPAAKLTSVDSFSGEYWVSHFRIPDNSLKGLSRMRIASYPQSAGTINSCDTLDNGFVADFTVMIRTKTEKPFIIPNGENPEIANVCLPWPDNGATVYTHDSILIDADLKAAVSTVDTALSGIHFAAYTYADSNGLQANKVYRLVEMRADHSPKIELSGPDTVRMAVYNTYTDSGVVVTDFCDDTRKGPGIVVQTIDTAKVGYQTLGLTAENSFGNRSDTIYRIVEVFDTIRPEIMLLGSDSIVHPVEEPFLDPGAIGIDHYYGYLQTTTEGSVNTDLVGTYYLTYTCTDPSGNEAEPKTRVVVVDDMTSVDERHYSHENVLFYPNPAGKILQMETIHLSEKPLNVRMYDITGRNVLDKQFVPESGINQYTISLDDIAQGSYIIHWEQDGVYGREKIAVTK